jgi:release factor glutamine methyltransferase
MTILNLKKYFFDELSPIHENSEVESFFFILTEYLHNLKRIDVSLAHDFEITETYLQQWKTIISDLKNEKPIQYITGEAWFYGYQFYVDENTLIPRPETEELVEWIIERTKYEVQSNKVKVQSTNFSILDIGTGSGCIPISLKKEIPNANISTIDVSEKAMAMAIKNAALNQVDINFIHQDVLKTEVLPEKYDIIVSNPPYVRNLEKHEIKKNVLAYEPHLALFVENDDALLFYRKIAQLALPDLKPNGKLFFEINQYLGSETLNLLKELGFKNIVLKKDFMRNDRMICCEL